MGINRFIVMKKYTMSDQTGQYLQNSFFAPKAKFWVPC
jgi:hypothetical protein